MRGSKAQTKSHQESHEEEMLRRIIAIDHRTASMNDSMHWIVRGQETLKEMVKAFGTSLIRVRVYLALDGKRNGKQIAASLKMKPPNVTREVVWLKRKQLIEVAKMKGNEVIYNKQPIDKIIRLSETLREKFNLGQNGRPRK